ncbi:MAG: hypothetical protein ACI8PV_000894 [Dinoroseobacter sp.]|jgi:hypothetical protein
MIEAKQRTNQTKIEDRDFDDLMASLFVLVTHHSLTNCGCTLSTIVERLDQLCRHPHIELYPQQLKVLLKMRQLWLTHLFKQSTTSYQH